MALKERDIEEVLTLALELEDAYIGELASLLLEHLKQGIWNASDETALERLRADLSPQVDTLTIASNKKLESGLGEAIIACLLAAAARDTKSLNSYYTKSKNLDIPNESTLNLQETKNQSLANQTSQGVITTIKRNNLAMSSQALKTWYSAAINAFEDIEQGASFDEALSKAVNTLGKGFKLKYQSGKSTSPDVALNRLLTTELSQAGGRMTLDVMNTYGWQLAITSAHYGARPTHALWQGRPFSVNGAVVVDGVYYPDMVSLTDYGSATGLKGINCRHSIEPYFPGITEPPDTSFKQAQEKYGMTSDEYYQAQQKQRGLERRIRATKAAISDMEQAGLGFESSSYVQKRLVLGKQQANMRNFCATTCLTRQRNREKAYRVSKQPRALLVKPVKQSGALNSKNDPSGIKRKRHAEQYYEQLRNSDHKQIAVKIADRTNIEIDDALRAINHLLIEKHELDIGYEKFNPDYDIAQSIQRILTGQKLEKHDEILFNHEYLESLYMAHGFPQRQAHKYANINYNYEQALSNWKEEQNNG